MDLLALNGEIMEDFFNQESGIPLFRSAHGMQLQAIRNEASDYCAKNKASSHLSGSFFSMDEIVCIKS